MRHEFEGSEYDPKVKQPPKPQIKKIDMQVCVKCNLHVRKPESSTNGCAHEYPVPIHKKVKE